MASNFSLRVPSSWPHNMDTTRNHRRCFILIYTLCPWSFSVPAPPVLTSRATLHLDCPTCLNQKRTIPHPLCQFCFTLLSHALICPMSFQCPTKSAPFSFTFSLVWSEAEEYNFVWFYYDGNKEINSGATHWLLLEIEWMEAAQKTNEIYQESSPGTWGASKYIRIDYFCDFYYIFFQSIINTLSLL